ncbi:hypothetical protein NDN08_004604 [Rhodosorus marinus]|uniref:BZIP domain-containing protein n=1 Tax=Rhodosorus marinus TaxID=101924 RepID=A0AAV8ULW7_9RHOD|nr:hypothetical protein NDN08_004604 [Rhodosorus marinus]
MDVLAVVATLKLGGDRVVYQLQVPRGSAYWEKLRSIWLTITGRNRRSRRRRRRAKFARKTLTEEELEQELELRRSRRAREREYYKKGLEKNKLAALEGELSKLKLELSGITGRPVAPVVACNDPVPPIGAPLLPDIEGQRETPAPTPPPPPPLPALAARPDSMGKICEGGTQALQRVEGSLPVKSTRRRNPAKSLPRREPTLLDCLREAGSNPQARLQKSGTIVIASEKSDEEGDYQAESLEAAAHLDLTEASAEPKPKSDTEDPAESRLLQSESNGPAGAGESVLEKASSENVEPVDAIKATGVKRAVSPVNNENMNESNTRPELKAALSDISSVLNMAVK